jgi:hypothetical protein
LKPGLEKHRHHLSSNAAFLDPTAAATSYTNLNMLPLGALRGGLACSAQWTSAAEAIARQGVRLLEEAKNSNNCIEPSRQAYSQALARELTRPDCAGRKTLSSAEKKLVSDWAKGGSEICASLLCLAVSSPPPYSSTRSMPPLLALAT